VRIGLPTAVVAAMGLFLVACMAGNEAPGPSLVLPEGTHPVGSGLPISAPNVPLSFGAITVCLDRPGNVTVDSVRPKDPTGGLTVTDFALRPNPAWHHHNMLGDQVGTLSDAGFHGVRRVTLVCEAKTGRSSELGLQVTKTGQGNGTSRSFIIRWHSRDRSGSLTVPFALVLCAGPTADTPACAVGPLTPG
jgi:hypothetical protein